MLSRLVITLLPRSKRLLISWLQSPSAWWLYLMPIMYMCSVTQSQPNLWDPVDCSPPGSSVHEIFRASILEVGCHFLLQGIFLIQVSNQHLLHLLHWQVDCLSLCHLGSPNAYYATRFIVLVRINFDVNSLGFLHFFRSYFVYAYKILNIFIPHSLLFLT